MKELLPEVPRLLAISPPTAGPWVDELEALVAAGVDGLMLRLVDGPVDLETVISRGLPAGLTVLVRPVDPLDVHRAWRHGLGLHLPSREDVAEWRDTHPGLLSASCHSLEELDAAASGGANLATLAPVYSPGSKPQDTRPTLGLPELRRACGQHAMPVLALGGIGPDQVAGVLAAGAHGAAGISAFFSGGHVHIEGARRMGEAMRAARAG